MPWQISSKTNIMRQEAKETQEHASTDHSEVTKLKACTHSGIIQEGHCTQAMQRTAV